MNWEHGPSKQTITSTLKLLFDVSVSLGELGSLHLKPEDLTGVKFDGDFLTFTREWRTGEALERICMLYPHACTPARSPLTAEIRYHRYHKPQDIFDPIKEMYRALPLYVLKPDVRRKLTKVFLEIEETPKEKLNFAQKYCRKAIICAFIEENLVLTSQSNVLGKCLNNQRDQTHVTKVLGLTKGDLAQRTAELGLPLEAFTLNTSRIEELTALLFACGPIIAKCNIEELKALPNETLRKLFTPVLEDPSSYQTKIEPDFDYLQFRPEIKPEIELFAQLATYDHPFAATAKENRMAVRALNDIVTEVVKEHEKKAPEITRD